MFKFLKEFFKPEEPKKQVKEFKFNDVNISITSGLKKVYYNYNSYRYEFEKRVLKKKGEHIISEISIEADSKYMTSPLIKPFVNYNIKTYYKNGQLKKKKTNFYEENYNENGLLHGKQYSSCGYGRVENYSHGKKHGYFHNKTNHKITMYLYDKKVFEINPPVSQYGDFSFLINNMDIIDWEGELCFKDKGDYIPLLSNINTKEFVKLLKTIEHVLCTYKEYGTLRRIIALFYRRLLSPKHKSSMVEILEYREKHKEKIKYIESLIFKKYNTNEEEYLDFLKHKKYLDLFCKRNKDNKYKEYTELIFDTKRVMSRYITGNEMVEYCYHYDISKKDIVNFLVYLFYRRYVGIETVKKEKYNFINYISYKGKVEDIYRIYLLEEDRRGGLTVGEEEEKLKLTRLFNTCFKRESEDKK